MRRRGFIPIDYWPKIIAFARGKDAPAGFDYVTYKALAEAHVGRELPN